MLSSQKNCCERSLVVQGELQRCWRVAMNVLKNIAVIGFESSPLRQKCAILGCQFQNAFAKTCTNNSAKFHTRINNDKQNDVSVEIDSITTTTNSGFNSVARRFSAKAAVSRTDTCEKAIDSACLRIDQWSDLVGRDFLSLRNFRKEDLYQFLWTAKDLKHRIKENKEHLQLLRGVNAVGIFHPKSTESRLSFDFGISKLGGNITYLEPDDLNQVSSSNMKDAAKLLSGMADIVVAGGFPQETVESLANECVVPVVSAFSDKQHPLQTLSQFLTLLEYFSYLRGINLSWVGSGTKGLNSLLYGCAKLGIDLRVATPPGYESDPTIMADAMRIAGKTGASFLVGNDPIQAVYRTDALIAGPWPGEGEVHDQRRLEEDFEGFRISRKMLREANGDWIFMHSLPRNSREVTDDIFNGEESKVHTEIENRMWVASALMLHLKQAYSPTVPFPKFVRG